jgi:hypothetical protein
MLQALAAGTYVMIIMMTSGSGKAVTTVQFYDKKACESAISLMEMKAVSQRWAPLSNWVFAVCVPQGTEIP